MPPLPKDILLHLSPFDEKKADEVFEQSLAALPGPPGAQVLTWFDQSGISDWVRSSTSKDLPAVLFLADCFLRLSRRYPSDFDLHELEFFLSLLSFVPSKRPHGKLVSIGENQEP